MNRTTTKTTKTARAAAKTVEPEVLEPMTWAERTAQRVHEVYTQLTSFDGLITPRRLLVSAVIGLIAGASTSYWGVALVQWLVMGALLSTGSAFLSFVVSVLASFFALFGAVTTYFKVQNFCVSLDLSVIGKLFKREPEVQRA
jgi:hypothetical protein